MIPRAFEPEITKIPPMDEVLRRHSLEQQADRRVRAGLLVAFAP
jgi:hypothetical protein